MMFGRDDNKDDTAQEPQHDAVLGDNGGTVHPDDQASPAFTASAPNVPAQSDTDVDLPEPVAHDEQSSSADADTPTDRTANPSDDQLLGIKQSALKELSPLVGHLDQSPEEKFRTTMMMIQASDDQSLIQTAYDAAQQISDEKTKAQALLDIVNEINYFTHK